MYQTTKIRLTGLTPLLMHNGQLADPLNPHAKALAEVTGKRKKTDADHLRVRKLEWTGGLYVDSDGAPCLPGEVVEAGLVDGAKKLRLGKVAKGGIIVAEDTPIEYPGPKTADGLWEHGGFLKTAGVRVGQVRVIRTRPMFPEWSATVSVQWDPEMITSESKLIEIAQYAGNAGIGDWRPKFGRFQVEKV